MKQTVSYNHHHDRAVTCTRNLGQVTCISNPHGKTWVLPVIFPSFATRESCRPLTCEKSSDMSSEPLALVEVQQRIVNSRYLRKHRWPGCESQITDRVGAIGCPQAYNSIRGPCDRYADGENHSHFHEVSFWPGGQSGGHAANLQKHLEWY